MNQNITILQKAGVFALACVGILALSGVYFIFKNVGDQNMKTFNVAGKGEIEVQATKATVSADFVGEGATSEVATNKLSDMSTKVFAALDTAGVKKETIKTQNVSVNPKYDYCYNYGPANYPTWCKTNPNQPKIIGYTATQNFTVSINDNKNLVEKVLGLFPSLGAQNVNGPNWQVDNDAAIMQARQKAVLDAKAKAESIAKSLGMSLGPVSSYSESTGGGYPQPIMYAKTMSVGSARAPEMDASVPVSQGTDKVTVDVNITYELR